MLTIGDKVRKVKGYQFDGVVRSVFQNSKGETRIVAEMEGNGMLHIFSEKDLELRDYEAPNVGELLEALKIADYLLNSNIEINAQKFVEISERFNKIAKKYLNEKH